MLREDSREKEGEERERETERHIERESGRGEREIYQLTLGSNP